MRQCFWSTTCCPRWATDNGFYPSRGPHPNVVAVHEVNTSGGQIYMVMEYVRGTTLKQWIAAERPRSTSAIVDMFLQAGRGLAAAHAQGLVHREHKPAPCNPASQPDAPSISKDLAGLQGAGLPRVAPRCPELPRSVAKFWQRIGPSTPASLGTP